MKKFLLILGFLQFINVSNAQINVEWVYKDASVSSQMSIRNLALDDDNNLYSFFTDAGAHNISKLDDDGNIIWEIGGSSVYSTPSDLIFKDDSLYFVYGVVVGNFINVYLSNFSQAGDFVFGNQIDILEIGGMFGAGSRSFLDEYNDNFFIGVNKIDPEQEDYYIYKTDTYGNVLSQTSIEGLNDNRITDFFVDDLGQLFTLANSRFIARRDNDLNYIWSYAVVSPTGENGGVGAMVSDEIGNLYAKVHFSTNDYDLMKFDENGEIQWTVSYEHPISGFDHVILEMIYQDSKIYLVGYSDQPDVPNILTLCFDEDGNKLWEDTYYLNADHQVCTPKIFIGYNNNIYSFGYAYPDLSEDRKDLFMRVYNQEGAVLTDFEYNSTGDANESCSNFAMSDNRIYLQGKSDDDMMIICLKSDYDLDVQELKDTNFDVFPNPTRYKLNIRFGNFSPGSEVSLVIRSLLGETLFSDKFLSPSETLSLNLPSGIYFITAEIDEETNYTKKIVVH